MAHPVSLTPIARQTVTAYADALRKRRIPFDRIVIFGSHAKGAQIQTSDIDVCVVSPTFGADYHQALVSLLKAAIDVDGDLDIVPYTPTDLDNQYDPLASEIRLYGKVVA